ncbi:MAG: hypothetical protein ACRDGM_07650, partial [bacterium]
VPSHDRQSSRRSATPFIAADRTVSAAARPARRRLSAFVRRPLRQHAMRRLVKGDDPTSSEVRPREGDEFEKLRVLTQRQRFAINVFQRHDGRDRTVTLRQNDRFAAQIRDVFCEWPHSR